MANIAIGYGNYIDGAALSGGSWSAAYPLANVKDKRLALVARSANATTGATLITMDLGASRLIRVVGLANHNLSAAATIAVQAATDAGFTNTVYNTGALPAWPSGTTPEDMTYPRPSSGVVVNFTARYWRIIVADTANPAGYVQIGRVFIGNAYVPSINMQSGASLTLETDTTFERSLSGAEFANEKPLRRVMRFALPPLPNAEAFGMAFEVSRRSSVVREVFVVPDADDSANRARRDFLGRLRQLSALEQPFGLYGTHAYEVSELL